MALLVAADFRTATVNEVCVGLTLTVAEASDANLVSAISGLTQRLEDFCNDKFEAETLTLNLQANGLAFLMLPYRTSSITSVNLRNANGTLTLQTAANYSLHSSLYASGSKATDTWDWIDVYADGDGLTSDTTYFWPTGANGVQVVGVMGWTTAPRDIKRALALMVWNHFKPLRRDLRLTQRMTAEGEVTELAPLDPTGLPEADEIIARFRREAFAAVG